MMSAQAMDFIDPDKVPEQMDLDLDEESEEKDLTDETKE